MGDATTWSFFLISLAIVAFIGTVLLIGLIFFLVRRGSADRQPPVGSNAPGQPLTNRETYNVVTDTTTGVNIRRSDNLFQALFILIAIVICSALGAVLAMFNDWGLPWFGGALVGGFAGLLLGVFSSGIFLMVYRAKRHAQGKHD